MSEKKKQQFTQKRLRELEKQVREYTDEDLLNEADELEKEMLAGNITYDLPNDFFQQILTKGKLIEAERERNKQKPVDLDVEKEDETKIKRVWDETVPPEAERINIPVMTITPPSQQPMVTGDAAGKPDKETDLSHVTKVMTAMESVPEQQLVRADIADTDKAKTEVPRAVEAQRSEAVAGEAGGEDNGQGRKKPRRKVKLRWKVLLTVMILVMVPMAFGITTGGKKHFSFRSWNRDKVQHQDIILNNIESEAIEDSYDGEMEAYDQIEHDIGIDALRIGDRPSGLVFTKSKPFDDYVYLYYKYEDNGYLMLKEAMHIDPTSVNVVSDGIEVADHVYNDWLQINIDYYVETISDGRQKYNAVVSADNSYYLITAVMDLQDYIKILEDLHF